MQYEFRCKSCSKSFTLEASPERAFCPYCGGESEAVAASPVELGEYIARLRGLYSEYTEKKFAPSEKGTILSGLRSIFSGKHPDQELDTGFFADVKAAVAELMPLAEASGESGAVAAAEALHIIIDPSEEKLPGDGLMLIACEQLAEPLLPIVPESELRAVLDEYEARFAKRSGVRPFPVQEKLLKSMRKELSRR